MSIQSNNERRYTDAIHFEIDSVSNAEGKDVIVEGFATKEGVNLKGNNVLLSSMQWDGAFKFFKDTVLAYHSQDMAPVGKIESRQLVDNGPSDKGLKVRVRFFKENDALFMRALREGTLNGFSIGYDVLKYHEGDNSTVFDQIQLYELSVVNIGANAEALFNVVDSLREKIDINKPNILTNKDNTMSKELETQLSQLTPVVDELKNKVNDLAENEKTREKLYKQVTDSLERRAKGEIGDAEMKSFMDKMRPEFERLSKEINEARSISVAQADRLQVSTTDLKYLIEGQQDKLDDRASLVFNAPVEYSKMGSNGARLFNLRNMHDAILLWSIQCKARGGNMRDIYESGLYKMFVNETRVFDPKLADSMAVGNTNYGAEWNPQRWSSEFIEYTRVMGAWMGRLRQFTNVDKLPFVNGRATSYKGSEALLDNSDRRRATNMKTGVTTPSYVEHCAAMLFSEMLNERSIVPLMQLVRTELATALQEGRSRGFLNGDTTGGSSTFDTGRTYANDALEGAHNGLRKYVFSTNAASVATACAAQSALTLVDIRKAIDTLGKKGINTQDLFIIAPTQLNGKILGLFDTMGQYGAVNTILTGQIPPVYGMGVFFDGEYPTDLNSSGIYDGSTTDYESLTIVHAPSWGLFEERPVTVEMNKDIMTQQWQFVATGRWDIKQISADDSTSGTFSACGLKYHV